jgi:hypothetical protein
MSRKRTNKLQPPVAVLLAVTTDTGFFRPGLRAVIIGAGQREIFVGKDCVKFIIPEFTLQFPDGFVKEGCQYGRDFIFERSENVDVKPT